MPPLPKKKTSTSRKQRRRAHISASIPDLVPCPQCRSPRRSHHACPVCGTYRGREVLAVGGEEPRRPPTRA
ncbi:MAG: 50S ribosomal protein L32 [Dehalococcoidia bacterium]|nr:50S ribosomal protein L32 [Dehalococcoidia bacterium]